MEVRSQLYSTQGLMGALMGVEHPSAIVYGRFLRQYDNMFTILKRDLDQVRGGRLGPSFMTFHVQLTWMNYLVVQLDAGDMDHIDPTDFTYGLTMLEVQNNLMWMPTINNIPALYAIRSAPRTLYPTSQPYNPC
jgi:hypothetical protein